MENQTNPLSDSGETKETKNVSSSKMLVKNKLVLALIIIGVAVALYMITAGSQGWFPFEKRGQESRIPRPYANGGAGKNQGEITVTPNPFAEWQTYRNEAYGFEVKYPKEWVIIHDLENGINLENSKDTNKIHERITFSAETANPYMTYKHMESIRLETTIAFQGKSAIKLTGGSVIIGRDIGILIIKSGNYYYSIRAPLDLFDQILSTFKFIETTTGTVR